MRIPLVKERPGWWLDASCLAVLVVLTTALARGAGWLLDLDVAVRDAVDAHRPDWADWVFGQVFNRLGGGTPLMVLCLLAGVWRLWRARAGSGAAPGNGTPTAGAALLGRLWPLLITVAGYLLTGLSIKPLKVWSHRLPPHDPANDPAFFAAPHPGFSGGPANESFPSGHAVNVFVWYTILVILLAPWLTARWRLVLRVVPVVVVTFTTIYLGFHWVTDTAAGLLIGVLLSRLISWVDWEALGSRRREPATAA
ncbi:phosphatase PAP2 family protein [Longispora sp. NPDC051575]|uniref:phosphatase PAP2 family protein n=1 Tax=Longispora sp. NPDC051575 TaxID=3154943 RepID=UPI003444E580